jgi:hypothetical protein
MPRKPSGQSYEKSGRRHARITLDPSTRVSFALAPGLDKDAADARAALLAALAVRFRAAGVDCAKGTPGRGLLEGVATAKGKPLEALQRVAAELCAGESVPQRPAAGETIRALGQRWTSGELARDFPDHVRAKKSAAHDERRFEKYVYGVAGHVAVADFTVECEFRAIVTTRFAAS